MKKFVFGAVVLSICFCLLCGCSNRPQDSSASASEPQSEPQPEIQTMTETELHQYFQQAFDAKGNTLDTPEQLALEVAEIKTFAVNAALPEGYEAQYKQWRKGYIESLLKTLQEEYEKIVAEVPLYNGVKSGAIFAELVDFEGDGIKELFILNLSWKAPLYDWACSIDVYGEDSGHAAKYGTMPLPSMYYWGLDFKSITFAQNNSHTYIHAHDEQGKTVFDWYYTVEGNSLLTADETSSRHYSADENYFFSAEKEITLEEYEAIHTKYTEEMTIIDTSSMDSIMPIQNRGILPELPSDVQAKDAFLNVLKASGAQYARLADMDGDGKDDLVTVENITMQNEYTGGTYRIPIFRAYTWDGSALQVIDMNQGKNYNNIGGIYREKSTGKIYVRYDGGAGPLSWYYYERISECIKISEEDYTVLIYGGQATSIEFIEGGQEGYYAELRQHRTKDVQKSDKSSRMEI